ncbi:MAG TPA: hypothetical protein VLF94_06200 [Chlamydiales bacterium]|nr:hypothetical protein [Chlamydiales bacterium]
MAQLSVLCFYPERMARIGAAVLGAVFLLVAPYVLYFQSSFVGLSSQVEKEVPSKPISFSLGLSGEGPVFPIPDLQGELMFSFDPPRPCGAVEGQRLLVRMKKSAESRRVTLPCRLDLEIQRDRLTFAKEKSPFWIELAAAPNGQIEARGYISQEEGKLDAGNFLAAVEESPLQAAQEFAEGSPFRLLAEARWWGRDQFREHLGSDGFAERLEVGAEVLEVREGDWLVWKERAWQKNAAAEDGKPIAHIQSMTGKTLVLEGWDLEGHTRIAIGAAASPPFKMKGEDLFSAIRIRSEKQISCMLEKQCMVLKTGDWVLKTNGRWKILRKAQEREACLSGKLAGELFVFEQIHTKQGQKMIQGRLYNPSRTQTVAIEMAAQSTRKLGVKSLRKGRTP